MHKRIIGLAVIVLLVGGVSHASAQEQTERYIPVGESPGMSGKYSYQGAIVAFDSATRTITVRGPEGTRDIKLSDKTRIWLDRSALKQTNVRGSAADLTVGRTVEIKFMDYDKMESCDWIKVAVTSAGG
jgi:hypothetical protein